MNDIGVAVYVTDPLIGPQVKPKHIPYGQYREKSLNDFQETVIGSIKYQVSGFVLGGKFGGEATTNATAIDDDVMFWIFLYKAVVDKLHVAQHIFLTSFAGAFSKATVIDKYNIIVVAVKITRIFCPAFYTSRIAMKIQDQSCGLIPEKVQAVNPYAGFHIKEVFPEWNVVFKLEILL